MDCEEGGVTRTIGTASHAYTLHFDYLASDEHACDIHVYICIMTFMCIMSFMSHSMHQPVCCSVLQCDR